MDVHIAELFLEAKEQILKSEEYSSKQKVKALFNLLTTILEEVTQSEKIVFTTLFSRATFMANRFKVDARLMYFIHTFRRDNERMQIGKHADAYIKLGIYIINELINWIWFEKEPNPIDTETSILFKAKDKEVIKFKPVIEVIIDAVDLEAFELYFYEDDDASVLKTARFDQVDKNEIFNSNVELLVRSFELPIHANLIDVELLSNGTYIPNAIVFIPDYLFDVTAIANSFKDYGHESMLRILNKFKQVENSIPLMVGNIANLFLDEIISKPDVKFNELLPKIFKLDPLGISNYDNNQIRELISQARDHYMNLKKVISLEFPGQGIKRDKVFLEPSFYSRDFGIQGRLDLFHHEEMTNQYDIVELKSGKPFRANVYGLSANHYTQTLLYDLMVKSTFGAHKKPNNYILYSKLNDKSLKYAPPAKFQQYEAMKVRNELMAIEIKIAKSANDAATLFEHLTVSNYNQIKGFELKDLEKFQKFYTQLDQNEKDYFNGIASFIAREQRLSKTGENGIHKSNGLSSLWLENPEEKEDRFGILKGLTIEDNRSQEMIPSLRLNRTEETSDLANFRRGDIAVLYPHDENPKAVLHNQIFKCTILEIDQDSVVIKLRNKQYNDALFKSIDYWNIEADRLDSGFNTLYRSLYEFCSSNKSKRDLWLGKLPPRIPENKKYDDLEILTKEQNLILDEMTNVKDFYLLWGPPGTGKTSIMLKSLTNRLFERTEETILLLAYTNRAVDEICAAIESIDHDFSQNYVRIGSSSGCGEQFKTRLLDHLISDLTSREEIRSFLQSKRIFVSTVSSIVSKVDLFKLKRFDRVIVDEASQILEPMLVGLLSRVQKAVLIGDHKQLPAVVTQHEALSKTNSDGLKKLGITDLRMSLFERLYNRCVQQKWDHAFGLLSYQGRMHEEIMKFPNTNFYSGKLHVLPKLTRLNAPLSFEQRKDSSMVIATHRFIYIPTPTDIVFNWKTNRYESDVIVQLIGQFEKLYQENSRTVDASTIGVITPYRAQIATIRKKLSEEMPHLVDTVTIDTVERYQGGARDIIIVSLCTNRLSQLKSLISLSEEGIDRKLNVAMTRAREQLIVVGNEDILKTNKTYQSLMEEAFEWNV
ncbi:MAG: AAA domain-containing protein [Saprospiraceae bacterium]|nr:AAA domain-containing protein [Saprospiraceae bacterium]